MSQTILVTGATSGFGKAIAEKFAEAGWQLIITGRRQEKLDALAGVLQQQYGATVWPLVFDVQDKAAVFAAIRSLEGRCNRIHVLVNNAGLALGKDTFDQASLDDWETMIDTNLKGLLYVSKAVLPLMLPHRAGHIINIGSVAGKDVYKEGNVYCATKHAVDAISKAQRIDLLSHRIKVTAIHPGAAETAFSLVRFKGDAAKASGVYRDYEPLQAADVADTVFYCANLPAHVCINDLVITALAQANPFYMHTETISG
jgi:3-hydroxy acid dehydrogenase/malonic semialdehyde reductase